MRRGKHRTLSLLVVALTIAGLTGAGAVPLDPVQWPRVQQALGAARHSGKPVYVYIYGQGLPKCMQTEQQTLSNRQVATALGNYEICRVNVYDPQNKDLLRKHKLLRSGEKETVAIVCPLPAHLFLNNQGQEICWLHGHLPPHLFIGTIEKVRSVVKAQAALRTNPQDARAYARLGHLYMELLPYNKCLCDKARENLSKAVALDPDNRKGAKAEAQLDLLILAIADNPEQVASDLYRYLQTYPHSSRRLEAQYYLAVAHVAAGNTQEGIEILKTFQTSDKSAPEYNSPWTTPALLLLERLRQHTGP